MVASRLVSGRAILKTPVRAEIVTGTVMLIHVLAAAEPASITRVMTDLGNMLAVVGASQFTAAIAFSIQT